MSAPKHVPVPDYVPGASPYISLATLEAAAAFDEELLEDEMAGGLRPDGRLEELQSLALWRNNRALYPVIEQRAKDRRIEQHWREHYRRRDAERAAMAAAELELKRQEERRRLAEWDAIFDIGAEEARAETARREEEERHAAKLRKELEALERKRQEEELAAEGRARLNAALDAIAIKWPEEADRVERARKHC
jgi:hypothetical protein